MAAWRTAELDAYAERSKDHLGARADDPAPGVRSTPGCDCRYCRFYRGEKGGIRYIMCSKEWERIPPATRGEIAESCGW